jgi:hypothetical protein
MLKIGWATRSITPDRPVMLHGQMLVERTLELIDRLWA